MRTAAGPRPLPLRDRLLRPTLPELWTFLAVALPSLAALLATLPAVDLAFQLRAGAEILDGRGIPSVDAWTFTAAGAPWLDQQWGAQAVLAAVFGAAGWTGLAVLRAALVGLVFGLVLAAIRRGAPALGPRPGAWLTLAAFVVAAPALALRPQLLGMACFAVALLLLAGRRDRPRGLWLLPLVAAAWANLHGSFVLAPLLVGLAWLADLHDRSPRARLTFVAAMATAAATLATPFGIEAWRYAASLSTNRDVTARITEWQPATPTDVPGALFWGSVVLVGLALVVIARRRRGLRWPALVTLLAFAALGAMAARGIAWWPAIAAVTLAGLLAPPAGGVSRPTPRGSALNAFVAVVLVLAGVALLPAWRPIDPGQGAPAGLLTFAPSGVTAALRERAGPSDRVWNPQPWGSWLEFAVPAPAYAFDSRIEVIPAQAWADGDVVAAAGPGWEAILDRYGVTIIVTQAPSTSPLTGPLRADGGWDLAFADADGAVWMRAVHR
jgi:hypothetical protein